MSKADEIMKRLFPNIETTTINIYEKQLKKLIECLEDNKTDIEKYMIYYKPILESGIKIIAEHYKVDRKATTLLPEDTVIILAYKDAFKPNYEEALKQLDRNIREEKNDR